VPKFSDQDIYGHSYVGAQCALTYLFGILPIPGCAVGQDGIFYGPRFGAESPYLGTDIELLGLFASNLQNPVLLNTGFGYYHFDGDYAFADTSPGDGIVWPIHAGITLFGK
jgi:hypothetical protein